jgi:hypothetical protein
LPFCGYRGTVRDGSAFVIFTNNISRFDNEPITDESTNCLCRSTRRVRLRSLRGHRQIIVSQLTQLLWSASPFADEMQSLGRPALARTGLHKIQQISRRGTFRATRITSGTSLDRNTQCANTIRDSRGLHTRSRSRSHPDVMKPQEDNIFH